MDPDRPLRRHPLGEVGALHELLNGSPRAEPEDLGETDAVEPLALETHLGPLPVEDGEELVEVGLGVRRHRLGAERWPGLGPARGVADPRRPVADDDHRQVARLLPGAQPPHRHGVPQVDVRRGRVDAELDPQPIPLREPRREMGAVLQVLRSPAELVDALSHGLRTLARKPAREARSTKTKSARTRASAGSPAGEGARLGIGQAQRRPMSLARTGEGTLPRVKTAPNEGPPPLPVHEEGADLAIGPPVPSTSAPGQRPGLSSPP